MRCYRPCSMGRLRESYRWQIKSNFPCRNKVSTSKNHENTFLKFNMENIMKKQGSKEKEDKNIQFLLAEYSALRDETMKRNSNHYQMISLNLLISATIITFGLQSSSPATVLFIVWTGEMIYRCSER